MEYPALEKFMSAMGITYKIKPDSIEYVSGGYKNLCMHITVFYRGDIELDEYRCYRYKKNVSSISNAGYTTLCNVTGTSLGSGVCLSIMGTTAGTVVTGTAMGDMSGYTLTLTGMEQTVDPVTWNDIRQKVKFEFRHENLVLNKGLDVKQWLDNVPSTIVHLSHIFNYDPAAPFTPLHLRIKNEKILKKLTETLEARKNDDPSKSYTASLYRDGLEAILKKVNEEAFETIIAARQGDNKELVHEFKPTPRTARPAGQRLCARHAARRR